MLALTHEVKRRDKSQLMPTQQLSSAAGSSSTAEAGLAKRRKRRSSAGGLSRGTLEDGNSAELHLGGFVSADQRRESLRPVRVASIVEISGFFLMFIQAVSLRRVCDVACLLTPTGDFCVFAQLKTWSFS